MPSLQTFSAQNGGSRKQDDQRPPIPGRQGDLPFDVYLAGMRSLPIP